MREILFKGAGVNPIFLRYRYEKVSGFCTGTDTSNLHKMACGQMLAHGVVLQK